MLHAQSPLLTHCPMTLPREAYLTADWYAREMATLWARNWVSVGRLVDFAVNKMRPVTVAGASVLVARSADGISAFHNSCRHRGAELCAVEQDVERLITCPYHAWAYASETGRLVSVAHATPTDDFSKADHGLRLVAHQIWNGFVFLNLAGTGPLTPDLGPAALDNWPMDGLVTGHRHERILECNWKVFWENYNECLHCPGIHPELCDMVPIYAKGIMSAHEAADWTPDQPPQPNLKPGAESWTPSGKACGPEFPCLTQAQRQEGYRFVTLYPTTYIVAHVDHVRAVRLEPLGPEKTRLVAERYFSPETLNQTGFDAANIAAFAKIVLQQDGDAVEMNQRGLRSPAHERGRLMPQEFDIHRFHNWVLDQMEAKT